MTEFGNRLKKLRRNADMTQEQLSKILEITPSAVGKYEAVPNAYPSIPILIKIADHFHVSIDYLLRGIVSSSLPTENSVNGDLTCTSVIQANHNSTVWSNVQTTSPEADELLRVYNSLGVRERLKLLNFAFTLEEGSEKI